MPEPPAPPPAPDLAAIAARCDLATPEPWFRGGLGFNRGGDIWCQLPGQDRSDVTGVVATIGPSSTADADGDFIAHARTDVPAFVAYARALEAANARLRAGLVEIRGLSMHADWCWSESLRVDIDRLLRGETLPGQES